MVKKNVLNNGVRILTEEIDYVHSVAIGIWVKVGSRNENISNSGISHFIEHLLFKGTKNRTAKQIAEELEAVGGSLNAFTTKEYTCFYAKVLSEHLDMAIDLLSDMFFNSNFEDIYIDRERNVVIEEIKMYEDSPDETIHDLFAKTVWHNHPLGRPILGTESTISAIDRKDIVDYFNSNYIPKNTVLSVAGNIKHEVVLEKLSKLFENWEDNSKDLEYNLSKPEYAREIIYREKEIEQVHLIIGTEGLPQEDPDTYGLLVLNNILGGGLSSRLFQKIREDHGLAYSTYSYHSSYSDSGLFSIYVGTSPNNVEKVLSIINNEFDELKAKGVSQIELQRTKDQTKGSLLLSLESVSNIMSRMGRSELCYDRYISAEEIVERVNSVTEEQVLKLCNQLFDKSNMALIGIGKKIDKFKLI